MPSLRRTFSSPVVRSSPYPSYTSSSSALHNANRGQGRRGNRRSSGSELSNRRVLADIEWWRVADGQRLDQGNDDDYQGEEVSNTDQRDENQLSEQLGSVTLSPDFTSGLFSSWTSPSALLITTSLPAEPSSPPTDQFSELSIRPHTPIHDDNDSVNSSRLATPESVFLPLEDLILDDRNPRGPSDQRRNRSVTMPNFPTKTKLFDDLLFNDIGDGNYTGPYADFTFSPLSSHSPLLLN